MGTSHIAPCFFEEIHTNELIWAILGLGDCLFSSNQPTHATEHFQKGFAIAQSLNNPHGCAWGYICMGRAAHALQDIRQAERHFERALSILREIGAESDIASVMLEQARVFEAQQQTAQAYQSYAESLPLFARQHLHSVPECLEGIAGLSATQQPTHAAQLLGAATTIRESAGMGLPPVYRAAYERTLATARAILGNEVFDAAFDAGRALTLDDAVAEALAAQHSG